MTNPAGKARALPGGTPGDPARGKPGQLSLMRVDAPASAGSTGDDLVKGGNGDERLAGFGTVIV